MKRKTQVFNVFSCMDDLETGKEIKWCENKTILNSDGSTEFIEEKCYMNEVERDKLFERISGNISDGLTDDAIEYFLQ